MISFPVAAFTQLVIERHIRYPDTLSHATPDEIRNGRIAEYLAPCQLGGIEPCHDIRILGKRYLVTKDGWKRVDLAYHVPDYGKIEIKSGHTLNEQEMRSYSPFVRIVQVKGISSHEKTWTASYMQELTAGEIIQHADAGNFWKKHIRNPDRPGRFMYTDSLPWRKIT